MKIIGEVKRTSGIYLITNNTNGKIYVGSSVNLYTRYKRHITDLNKGIHPNSFLLNSWNKYGSENFSFTTIELVYDKNKLIEREQYWIDKLNVCDEKIGYNISPIAGSALGRKQSDEERKKRRLHIKCRPILQFDGNGKLIKEWSSGGDLSRELNINRYTLRNRIQRGSKFVDSFFIYKDEFTEDLLKEVLLNNRSIINTKKVNQYDENGTFIRTWESIKLAADSLKIHASHISGVCKGKSKQTGGFKWSYAN